MSEDDSPLNNGKIDWLVRKILGHTYHLRMAHSIIVPAMTTTRLFRNENYADMLHFSTATDYMKFKLTPIYLLLASMHVQYILLNVNGRRSYI